MTEAPISYGNAPRGVGFKDVSHAADQLLRAGERPTVEKIRAKIGSGSPNTVGPLLDEWWKRLSGRFDSGPAAFHRLPEAVSHIAEALWLRALDEARGRAVLEQAIDRRGIVQDQERIEIRSHVLSLREAELDLRVRDRDKTIAELETRLQLLATALKKEQAGRSELIRRLDALKPAPVAPGVKAPRVVKRKKPTRRPKVAKRSTRKLPVKIQRRRQSAKNKQRRRR